MISTSDWKTKDCVYNYQKLFDSVLDLFADAKDRWAIETLDWFTQGVFGGVYTSNFNNEDSDDNDSDSETATILARRAARSSANPFDSPNIRKNSLGKTSPVRYRDRNSSL
ncbi:hypothetical protein B0H19DRAFT_141933 [Mycena capillaripes]|nr:hypothetical protein B0H19DRAFT_141933 [Mycena capillaripes]